MKKRTSRIILTIILIVLCFIAFESNFTRMQFFSTTAGIYCKIGYFDSAMVNYQKALSYDPGNQELQDRLHKTELAIEFKNYLDNIRPLLLEFKAINDQWSNLTVGETNRTIDDLSAASKINEDLIPRLNKLLDQTRGMQSVKELKGINNDLVVSINSTKDALTISTHMLNSLYFSDSQNKQIQQYTSSAFFANKRFFQTLDAKASELQVPMNGFWSDVN